MGKRIHALAQQLLGKDTVEQCSLEDIREYTVKYPFVAAAQFLLLEKLKNDEPAFHAQKQKAILYYHDPLSFQEFIYPERFITDLDDVEDSVLAEDNADIIETASSVQTIENKPSFVEALDENPHLEEATPSQPAVDFTKSDEVDKAEEEKQDERPFEYIPAPASLSLESVAKDFRSEIIPEKEDETAPAFEPFHTVDYFASQGIKLSQEDFSKDKFGKQLKSFTEWLKSMKRIPATEGPPAEVSENKVTNLAEDSIQQEDVYTEAMAEVWIKQGNKAKAIEVYNKLSLINPSKMAYFAAQIENLKRS